MYIIIIIMIIKSIRTWHNLEKNYIKEHFRDSIFWRCTLNILKHSTFWQFTLCRYKHAKLHIFIMLYRLRLSETREVTWCRAYPRLSAPKLRDTRRNLINHITIWTSSWMLYHLSNIGKMLRTLFTWYFSRYLILGLRYVIRVYLPT